MRALTICNQTIGTLQGICAKYLAVHETLSEAELIELSRLFQDIDLTSINKIIDPKHVQFIDSNREPQNIYEYIAKKEAHVVATTNR